jgi:hypothetical protein
LASLLYGDLTASYSIYQAIDAVAASSGLIVDSFRCDDGETSAALLVNAAIALNITTLVLTKDDTHM